ncbi:phosphoesterase [Halobacteriales archaeon SW_7_71_33]|nr:MAG: phosphoesterase [Halobacteriales archaeon SW_7_71_33]
MSDPESRDDPGSRDREARVREAVAGRREVLNHAITEELSITEPERLYEASRYLLDAGGKRLRPTTLLLVAESLAEVDPGAVDYRSFPDLTGGTVDVLAPAVSVETIQSFTLIHDDIMDDDPMRRGVTSVHRAYDLETAILAGDTLYSKAFSIMLGNGAPTDRTVRAVEILASTCTKICEGQALDVDFEDRDDVALEEYLRMVKQKTAMLYAASAGLSPVLLGADESVVEAMFSFGLDVGRAFQIRDDVLDLTVPSERLGKQRGSDLVEEKKTLITVHAREHGVDVDSLVETDSVADVTEAEVDDAVARLQEAGSIDYADETARDLVESGKQQLEVLPDNEARERLFDLADFLVERGY